MIEYFSIFSQLVVFIFFSYFPVNKTTSKYLTTSSKDLSAIHYFVINMPILMFILLLFSFTEISLENAFIIILSTYSILFFLSLKEIYNYVKYKNFLIVVLFLLINFALFIDIARDLELSWDGLTTWKLRANDFYLGSNYFNKTTDVVLPQYPHLGTYMWAFFWKNSFLEYEYFGRLFQAYLYVLSFFAISSCFENINFLKKKLIIVLLILFTYQPDLRGLQDIYIFSLLILFGFFIHQKLKLNSEINSFAILILIILPWIKSEGIFYSIFLTIIYLVIEKKLIKKYFFSVIIFALIIFQLGMNYFYFDLRSLFQFEIDMTNIASDNSILLFFTKIINILFYSAQASFRNPIIIIDLLVIIMCFYYSKFEKNNIPYLLFLFLNISFIFAIYVISPDELKWHLQTSIDRLLLQTSGIYMYLLVFLNNKKYIKI